MRPRVHFCDFWDGFTPEDTGIPALLLQAGVEIDATDQDPEYLVFGDFGFQNYRYDHLVKVSVTGENTIPDFNLADYALSYAPITLGDRHCQNVIIDHGMVPPSMEQAALLASEKTRFCNFIYANSSAVSADPTRERFFELLSKYKRVDAPGAACNNMENVVPHSAGVQAKLAFMGSCKFSIAFENSSQPGYTTEKLVHAYGANTVPIYWGNPDVGRYFDTASMINCHEYSSFEAVVDQVRRLDDDAELYLATLAANRTHSAALDAYKTGRLDFFRRIFTTPPAEARRRTNHGRQGGMPPHRMLLPKT